jgi:hypothetical protein
MRRDARVLRNVFWGGRSEIKPSEISSFAYRDWLASDYYRSTPTVKPCRYERTHYTY